LEETHGARQGARVLAGVLGAMDDPGEEAVTKALREAMAEGRIDLLGLSRQLPARPELPPELVPPALRRVEVSRANIGDYDLLLAGGAR